MNLGNVSVRSQLGRNVSADIFRVLRFSAFDRIFGKGSNAVTMSVGREIGLSLGNSLKSGLPDDYFFNVASFFRDNNIGVISVSQDKNIFILNVEECVTCSGMPNQDKFVCAFEGGIISGIFESYYSEAFIAEEIKCWAHGDSICQFLIKSKKEHIDG